MKKLRVLFTIIAVLFITANANAQAGITSIDGHGVSGTIETWKAIALLVAPFVLTATVIAVSYVAYARKKSTATS